MWIAVFTIATVAAIAFGMAAIVLQWGNWKSAGARPTRRFGSQADARTGQEVGSAGRLLLLERMKSLHVDPTEFARLQPLAFRALSIRCRACDSTAHCAADLARGSKGESRQQWREYCPNASMLNMLGIVWSCYPGGNDMVSAS